MFQSQVLVLAKRSAMTEGHTQDFTVLENNTVLLIFNNETNTLQQAAEKPRLEPHFQVDIGVMKASK